jgi:hypothetical protein
LPNSPNPDIGLQAQFEWTLSTAVNRKMMGHSRSPSLYMGIPPAGYISQKIA